MVVVGLNAMPGLRNGILAGCSNVFSAMRSAAKSAVNAAKAELKIHSLSQVFEDEVDVMTMRGLSKGVLKERKAQAQVIRDDTINQQAYNQNSTLPLTGNTFTIRDAQDSFALTTDITALIRRRQHGRGIKLA